MAETQLASMFIGSADDGDDIERGRPSDVGNMIHILDGQTDVILDFITLDNIIDDTHKKSLESYIETYDAIVLGGDGFSYDKHLEKRNRIIIPDEDGTYQEFVLFEVDKYRDTEGRKTHFYAHATYLELKKAKVIYPTRREGFTLSQHAGWALNDTGWTVGIVEAEGTRTFNIENHTNPYEFLKRLANEFEVEIRFRVEHDGRRITARYVDFLERIGDWKGREVEFGRDLDEIRRIEKQDVVTALLGLGPERDDGTRIEVLVEDEEALQRWGRVDEHGNLHHLIEPYEIQSERQEMTEEEARRYTRTALDKRINTQVTYETTILDLEEVPGLEHEKIRFGDTIRIKDTYFNPPLYLEARVFEIERSIKNKAKKDIKLGDYIEYTEEEVNAIWNQLRNEIRSRILELAEPQKIESPTAPEIKTHEVNPIWIDTSKEPHVAHIADIENDEWIKITPTEAEEVNAPSRQETIIEDEIYNGLKWNKLTGLSVERIDGKARTLISGTDGIKVQQKIGGIWSDMFFVDQDGNVKFAGHLEGATGVFSGEIKTKKLRVRADSVHDFYDFGIEIETAQWQPDLDNPFVRTGYINFNTGNDALEIYRIDNNGVYRPLQGFFVEAEQVWFTGKMQLTPYETGRGDVLKLSGGSSNHVYIEFYRSESFDRSAYIGIPTANSEHFVINAHGVTGELRLRGANVYVENRLINPQAYNVTVQNPANVYVTSNGYFARSTSSKRYKADIQYNDIDYKNILKLQQASWVDRSEFENNNMSVEGLKRYYGAIAEDFEKIGLSEFVVYNENGEVENFSDRAWVLLIPNINDILNELKQIKERLERLENEGNSV